MDKDDGRVVCNFCVQALTNKPLTIYGDGLQTRSFCYIDDLVKGLILLMNSIIEVPVNLGNPKEYNMIELAEKILEMTDSDCGYNLNQLPEDDPQRRCPDISFAKDNLAWRPKVRLSEGLSYTIDWFRKCLNE